MADWGMAAATGSLFGANLPSGFSHRDDFISTAEEAELAAHIARVEFAAFEMREPSARPVSPWSRRRLAAVAVRDAIASVRAAVTSRGRQDAPQDDA